MKDLIEHIDALIMEYDCVIIPDFGGFVLNKESASVRRENILPPSITVGFNPALKHNDGLLAESYMKSKSISYDTACKQIGESVKKINGFLGAKQPVIFPNLGAFVLNEESNLIFTPIKEKLHHPSTIGFSPIELMRLEDIARANQTKIQEYRQFGIKQTLASVAATAAAVLLFFTFSTPIKDIDRSQKSSFFTTNNLSSTNTTLDVEQNAGALLDKKDEIPTLHKEKKTEQPTKGEIAASSTQQKENQNPVENIKPNKPSTGFYIIVGSSPTEAIAKKMVQDLKNEGFSDATIVPSKSRTRIAVAQFENKTVAERYLNNFRTEYLEFSDAWLLISR